MPTTPPGGGRTRRAETTVVYAAGLVQGIVLVTFPAASTIFTDPAGFGLSRTRYGTMFLPQAAMAVLASVVGSSLSRRFGLKRVFLAGLGLDLASMALLTVSATVEHHSGAAFALLLAATTCLGGGFGLTVPALNTFTAVFRPHAVDRAVLELNALLGLGTALAPAFVAVFVGVGLWWGLPLVSAVLLMGVILIATRLPLHAEAAPTPGGLWRRLPRGFWVFAAFAVLYGICETMNGNWSQLEMTGTLGASRAVASLALTAFWGMVTVGRLVFGAIERWLPTRRTFHLLPFALVATFVVVAELPRGSGGLGVVVFGLAGLGCSALLPLTISFGEEGLTTIAGSVAGLVIAFYELGYGVAAFGTGPLQSSGIRLSDLFLATAVVAASMGALSFALARPSRLPPASHA